MSEIVASGRTFLDPAKLLERAGIAPGTVIGDFGVGGAAYFAVQAGKMVGAHGVVYGIDVFKPALSGASSKAKLAGCRNFKPVWSNLEMFGAARSVTNDSVDLGILVNVLHQSKKQRDVLKECARMLKPGGRLLIVDWRKGGERFGPRRDAIVSANRVLDLCTQVGLALFDQFEAGPYHYGIIVVKAG